MLTIQWQFDLVLKQCEVSQGLDCNNRMTREINLMCFIDLKNSVMNYSPSRRSKPVRPLFIFGIQIKIFLMESESSLT